MKKVIFRDYQKIPIKMWLADMESSAYEQAENLSKLPFAFKHIAIMPDTHTGFGMPIGGVLATQKVVIPNAVGVDIGCGMCAVRTSLKEIDKETIKTIFGGSKDYKGGIRSTVPVGFSHHSKKQDTNLMPNEDNIDYVIEREYSSALKQLGTLGGGNHFIEIQKGSDGFIWIMIHSGSRNLGFKVANYYNKIAVALNKKWFTSVPKNHELAFLPLDSEEGQNYLREMNYCVEFALANRKLMMERICDTLINVLSNGKNKEGICYADLRDKFNNELINIAHNYATMENHFGVNVMVHRKGATSAREGQLGIIPGSQETKSYIVRGKGNPESFMSCSHGAGRVMSRTRAKNELNLEEEIKKMSDKGIVHSIRNKNNLDEAPSAYKDIATVMENQKDLVDIVVELTPLGVIKG